MKNYISILILLCLSSFAKAQDDAINSQYLVNPYYVNPGAAGMNGLQNFHLGYRSALSSIQNHPSTYYGSYNGLAGKSVALGVMVLNDQIASINRYKMQFSYAFNWQASSNTRMGLGVNAEFHQYNLDSGVKTDPLTNSNDPLLLEAINGNQYADATIGLYGVYKEKFQFGFTLPNLIRARLNKDVDEERDPFSQAAKQFTAYGAYRFDIKDYDFAVEPSVMVRKSLDAPIITDVNVKTYFLQNKLIAGGTLRVIDSETLVGVLLGIKFGSLRLYYNYDVSYQQTQKYHTGAHEITLNFELSGKKKMTEEEMKIKEAEAAMPAK